MQDFPLEDFEKQMEFLKEGKFILTEAEMVFEAADCVRFGRDIFVTLTHVRVQIGENKNNLFNDACIVLPTYLKVIKVYNQCYTHTM